MGFVWPFARVARDLSEKGLLFNITYNRGSKRAPPTVRSRADRQSWSCSRLVQVQHFFYCFLKGLVEAGWSRRAATIGTRCDIQTDCAVCKAIWTLTLASRGTAQGLSRFWSGGSGHQGSCKLWGLRWKADSLGHDLDVFIESTFTTVSFGYFYYLEFSFKSL